MENHVVSLEIAKELKEKGIDFKSSFVWGKVGEEWKCLPMNWTPQYFYSRIVFNKDSVETYPAPLFTELLEALEVEPGSAVTIIKRSDRVETYFQTWFGEKVVCDPNPCNALAKLLIKIKEGE